MFRILTLSVSFLFLQRLTGQLSVDSLRIIDYHVHTFSGELIDNLKKQGYDMATSGFQILHQDNTTYGNIDSIIQNNRASKMLLISAGYAFKDLNNSSEVVEKLAVQRENNLLSRLVKSQPDKFVGFAGVNPLKRFTNQEIIRCDQDLGLHGIKLHLQGCKIDLNNSDHLDSLLKVFNLASERHLPLLIHSNAWSIDTGAEYARIFVDSILNKIDPVTIIFAHSGGGGLYFNFNYDFLTEFSNYLKHKNGSNRHKIYFELSGLVSIVDYPGERPMSELEHLIEDIGIDRFLFGSDYPYRNSTTYLKEIYLELNMDDSILKKIVERDIFHELRNR